ncbi:D-alanine--D-alanine ligase [bacterium]|nr:D-alanine--D-alanine ligase [bacterium]
MRLFIVHSAPEESGTDDDPDLISSVAILDQARAVHQAAIELGYQSRCYPVIEITETIHDIIHAKPDVIFNLCEEYQGRTRYELNIASLWELIGIPYTGNPPLTLGLAQDKVMTKRLLQGKNIRTPAYQVFKSVPENVMLEFPLIAKPSCEDASLGIISTRAVSYSLSELKKNVEILLEKYRQPILVERYISGREFNISVFGMPPKVLAVSELDFSELSDTEAKIASYEAKWMPDHPAYQKTPVHCPADIPDELRIKIEDVATQVFTLLGGRDYGRVDMRMDLQGRLYVLEFNPNPDISPDAGFIKAVRASGLSYSDFVEELIQVAFLREKND